MITLRVGALWDHNKKITYTMLGGFFVTYSAAIICFIITIIDLRSEYDLVFCLYHGLMIAQRGSSSSHLSIRAS